MSAFCRRTRRYRRLKSPGAAVANATWSEGAGELSIKIAHGIGSGVTVKVELEDVMTPPAAVASSSSSSTLHSEHGGKLIDGPTALQTQAIVAQPLPGLQWDSAIDHPAVESTVTVSFNVSGAVGLGGFVRIVLPADGWSMPQQPNVQLWSPPSNSSSAAIQGTATFASASRTLRIAITHGSVSSHSSLFIAVKQVTTPPSERSASVANVSTYDNQDRLIDGPTAIVTNAIVPGVLGGSNHFVAASTPHSAYR